MQGGKSSNVLASIIMLIVFAPIYLVALFRVKFFATAKVAGMPVGGFLIWIYYLVVAAMALILVAVINAREQA
jgi:hypothetical protein